LQVQINAVYTASKKRYGSRKVYQRLRVLKVCGSRDRVARLMRQNGWFSIRCHKFKRTTQSQPHDPIAPNHLQRDFTAPHPNCKWVSDITYVWTAEGWLYLAVVLDLFSRRVVGWSMQERLTRPLVLAAFSMAAQQRQLSAQLLFHSDRGSQYASDDFSELLGMFAVRQSMSRTAECYDNAVAESFFAQYKLECVPLGGFDTRAHARSETFEYLEVFYNRQRIHSTLDYQTPVEFEQATSVT
jgi:transposase InsO family protein